MNTPLILTSVALLAGVAARPIEDNNRGDELRELIRSPNSDGQAFLGHIPSGFDSLNSLQLHDIHDNTHGEDDGDAADGSKSPKLSGVDSSDPDPGLASPYMGPQRHMVNLEQEIGSPAFRPETPTPSSPAPRKTELPQPALKDQDYSPMVVILVFSSIAALVLLGLTVTIVYAAQLLRRTVLRENVWKSVAGVRGEKEDVDWSEKEKIGQPRDTGSLLENGDDQSVIAAREVPSGPLLHSTLGPTEASEDFVEDPDVVPLPENPPVSSVPAVRDQNPDRNMGLVLISWTYDNWVTHFMIAIFGWLGVLFGGGRDR